MTCFRATVVYWEAVLRMEMKVCWLSVLAHPEKPAWDPKGSHVEAPGTAYTFPGAYGSAGLPQRLYPWTQEEHENSWHSG